MAKVTHDDEDGCARYMQQPNLIYTTLTTSSSTYGHRKVKA
jgi:hypothetical protein